MYFKMSESFFNDHSKNYFYRQTLSCNPTNILKKTEGKIVLYNSNCKMQEHICIKLIMIWNY